MAIPAVDGILSVLYILWPLGGMFLRADWGIVASSFSDSEIVGALWRSI